MQLPWKQSYGLFLFVMMVLWLVQPVFAQSDEPLPEAARGKFGSPDYVPNRIESDRVSEDTLFELEFVRPYYAWKDEILEKYGYAYAADYYAVGLKASDSLPGTDDDAASAVFRFSGFWQLFGRGTNNTGTLVYLVEQRHRYTDNSVSPFASDSLGYAGFLGIPYSDEGGRWHLTNLYWNQEWENGFGFAAGFLDVTDWVDVYALTSPWTDFYNFVFSIGAATMDLPDDAALGAGAGGWLTDEVYLIAGFEDLNADPTDPFQGFETFWNDHEFFKHVEVGWSTSKEQYYLDNLHLTLWHADERDDMGVEDGWGAFLSFSHSVGDRWLLFARGGYADEGGSLLQKSVSVGGAYAPNGMGELGTGHQLGFGANWGDPNDELFGSGLNHQYAFEVYYRFQVTKELAITPDVQLLINPALNPEEDTIWAYGLRARLAF
jgi:porin